MLFRSGSDFDGFIRPTLAGLGSARDLGRLEAALVSRYGGDGELIAGGNALRVLRSGWGAGRLVGGGEEVREAVGEARG